MRRHTTTGSKNTLCNCHTGQVFGRSFDTYHYNTLTGSMPFCSIICKEHNLSSSSTRRCRKTASQNFCLFQSSLIKYRMKQFIQFIGLTAHQSCFFINHTLMQQIHCNLYHSCTGTFTITRLKEPKLTFLNGKLHILHVLIVVFQFSLQHIQLFIDFRHSLFHGRIFSSTLFFANTCKFCPALRTNLCNLLRSTDTCHNVFTLCIDQIFTIKQVFTRTGIAAETNTCS